jgi:HK97 family phage major capsid protein
MAFTKDDLGLLVGVEAHRAYKASLVDRRTELDQEFAGIRMSDAARDEWALIEELMGDVDLTITELEARAAKIAAAGDDPRKVERPAAPNIVRNRQTPDNVHDLAAYRNFVRDVDDLPAAYREGAKRYLETIDQDKAHALDRVMKEVVEDRPGTLAKYVLEFGSPAYEKAFARYFMSGGREQAALGSYSSSGADGGYALPVTLDPSLIPTQNVEISDLRRIARVVSITGKEWNGVTSGGISVSRVGEASAVTATSPTLAQPRVVPTAVKAEIRYSVEVDGDWAQLGAEMAREIAEAKANEEATTFTTGTGDGATGPQGIERIGDSKIIWTQASASFGVEDVYACETDTSTGSGGNPLPERWRKNASFLGNKSIYNKIRQFSVGTVGEGSIWQRGIAAGMPNELIGYPAYENSVMDATVTNGNDILIFGDFSKFIIVDRVGMSLEVNPHVVDGDGKSTFQRALMAFWRNGSKVLVDDAFRKLRVGEGS